MIKSENGMVMINVEDKKEMMVDFTTVIKAVYETVKLDKPDDVCAENVILGAVEIALDKNVVIREDEPDETTEPENETAEQKEAPVAVVEIKVPEELNSAMNKVIKDIFGEEFLNGMKKKEGEE